MFTKFKEDTTFINELSSILSPKFSGQIIKHHVEPLTEYGENFGSEIVKIDIVVEKENGEKQDIHAVGKLIPPTEMQMEIFDTQVSFKNEIGFYGDIVPALQEFRKQSGLEPMDYFPDFYGARTSLNPASGKVDNDAIILMENLKVSGFGNLDRFEGFDLDGAKMILKDLAIFQATTVALRKKQPDVFKERVAPYLSLWKSPDFPLNFDAILKENPKTSHLVSRLNRLVAKKRLKKIREPWATITHNDLWTNNIMVTEKAGHIDRVKFVDFQIPDYGSPMTDVLFFLLSSVQLPVLRYHFDKLLEHYYKEFVKVVKSFRVDLKDFTYDSFLDEMQHEGHYQVYHSLFMTFVLLGPKGMPKMPGKVKQWNPGQVGTPLNNGQVNGHDHVKKPEPTGPPPMPATLSMKERIWFIVELAERKKWL